jgi:phytoene dehydrogenase-like protein
MKKYDAIIVGAGHNGLTNAAYLAKSGLDVLILEKNDYIGGAAVTREMHDGWFYSSCSYVCSMMRQAIHRDLNLTKHGLVLVPYLGTVVFADNGDTMTSYHSEEAEYNQLRQRSPHDADAMFRFQTDLGRYAQLIRKPYFELHLIRHHFDLGILRNYCGWPNNSGLWEKKSYTSTYDFLL